MTYCRDCKWLVGKIHSIGIECQNPKRKGTWRTGVAHIKYPTTPPCKFFEEGESKARDRWRLYQFTKRYGTAWNRREE